MPQDMTDESLRRIIGASARAARLRLELTQEDVAERLGTSSEVYGRLERGSMAPSVNSLRRLCLALNLSSDLALGLVGNESSVEPLAPPPKSQQPGCRHYQRLIRRARLLSPQSLRVMAQLATLLSAKQSPTQPEPPKE
jgi:transcriptional regulator with XRE-family HTH domain